MNRIDFWSNPANADKDMKSQSFYPHTLPEFYLHLNGFSDIINNSIRKYVLDKNVSILDLGCGTGRGLVDLYRSGYHNLAGIDINPYAIELGRETFKELKAVSLVSCPVEDIVNLVEFDVIYSVGCLMHIPYEMDWIFLQIAKGAKQFIITAENELDSNVIKYPRDYRDIFDKLGWQQIEEESGDKYPPISKATIKRVFKRK